jgi:hypothetical protein
MKNLNKKVRIFSGSLGSNEGATVREMGSSELRVTSHNGPTSKSAAKWSGEQNIHVRRTTYGRR